MNQWIVIPSALPCIELDLILTIHQKLANYEFPVSIQSSMGLLLGKSNLVPGSDGAGIVESVGSRVTKFHQGDHVCTHMTRGICDSEFPSFEDINAGLGQTLDGTLRQYGVFHETSLINMPSNLDYRQAATLTCSGLTAWNALFGLDSKGPGPGSTVLVQGTGGVSIAALQVRYCLKQLNSFLKRLIILKG